MKIVKEPKQTTVVNRNNGIGKAITILGFTLGGVFGYRWWLNKKNATDEAGKLQDDVFTQQASAIKNAIDGAGTDEDTLFSIAPLITDWRKVLEAYSRLTTGRNLENDLSAELDAAEYKKFMDLLGYKGREKTNPKNTNSQVFTEPKASATLPMGTSVFLSWRDPKKQVINGYTEYSRYPFYPIKFPRPKILPKKAAKLGVVVGSRKLSYGNGNVSIMLIQVRFSNGKNMWFREPDLGKFFTAVKGVSGINNVTIA